ncbi:polyadenylate-binding protein-like [Anopheles nili]|uniref:polyadenylate-binding protein-like n=1 Tax=Anopheles nili TaxID=185578 RepID=UPI00237B99E3|nr:polyadenylate-binding protein-like [Anopheles nili]
MCNPHHMVDDLSKYHIYVGNLGQDVNVNLFTMFEEYDPIGHRLIMSDGESRGFGFVAFQGLKNAKKAVKAMHGKTLPNGNTLCIPENKRKHNMFEELIRKSRMKSQHLTSYRRLSLYVKNLDDTIDDERLRKEFAPYGTITSAKVILDEGRSKGFGFVCFSALDEATKAVTEMNGRIVGSKPLYVALAQRKEECKSHLASQYIQRVNSLRMQHIGQVYQQGGTGNQNVAGPSKYQPKNPSAIETREFEGTRQL